MKILHLSDTTLSGAPYRLSKTYNKYSGHESRHIVWHPVVHTRVFQCDMIGSEMSKAQIKKWFEWADVIHYHNRWKRQEIFTHHKLKPPKKPSLIQIHSPRESEDFSEEVESGISIAVIAQYHTRQWPEKRFIVPNVVDIYDELHKPVDKPFRNIPVVSYSPSNAICRGWDDKSYGIVSPVMRRLSIGNEAIYQRIVNMPHADCLRLKQTADIGIDEVSTGSYHMSSLEYLSMGVACIGRLDEQCERVIKDLTGADWLPWIMSSPAKFKFDITSLVRGRQYIEIGQKSREWMEKYWNPKDICDFYTQLYESL